MSIWRDTELVRLHQQARLREAEQYRLVQEAQKANVANAVLTKPIYAPALAYIGGWLITWGNRLQTHYGSLADNLADNFSPTVPCAVDTKFE